jgi:hypothetical protein
MIAMVVSYGAGGRCVEPQRRMPFHHVKPEAAIPSPRENKLKRSPVMIETLWSNGIVTVAAPTQFDAGRSDRPARAHISSQGRTGADVSDH